MELPRGALTNCPYRTFGTSQESKYSLGYKILTKLPLLNTTGIYKHRYSDRLSLSNLQDLSRMISLLGYKILTNLPVVGQDTIVSSTSLSFFREVLSDYTKVVSKVFKLYMIWRLCQHICNLLICANILELYCSPSAPYHECSDTGFLCALTCHGTQGSPSSLCNYGYLIESQWIPSPDRIDLSTTSETIWIQNWWNMLQCILLLP
jgi:hypothetical protein